MWSGSIREVDNYVGRWRVAADRLQTRASNAYAGASLTLARARERSETLLRGLGDIARELSDVWIQPAEFNRQMSERGWIASDDMPMELLRMVVAAASRSVDEAEAILVQAHDEMYLRRGLERLARVPAIAPRISLLERALTDHAEGRLHASIPVVLIQIDGIVQDLAGRSFFAQRPPRSLHLQDSVVGRASGLTELAKSLGMQRVGLSTTPISIPYRHGILHGRDIQYATPLVAAKTWAALFALRPWASRMTAPSLDAEPDWADDISEPWAHAWSSGSRAARLLGMTAGRELADGRSVQAATPVRSRREERSVARPAHRRARQQRGWRHELNRPSDATIGTATGNGKTPKVMPARIEEE